MHNFDMPIDEILNRPTSKEITIVTNSDSYKRTVYHYQYSVNPVQNFRHENIEISEEIEISFNFDDEFFVNMKPFWSKFENNKPNPYYSDIIISFGDEYLHLTNYSFKIEVGQTLQSTIKIFLDTETGDYKRIKSVFV